MSPTTPAWLNGVWTRDWIERQGQRSSPLTVHYVQVPGFFADMRIPKDRPLFHGARSFADLTDDDLRALAAQRGFTGPVTAAGDTITWQHDIDFQPPDPDGGADIGRIEQRGPTEMYEHALDSSYVESWRSLSAGDERFLVIRIEGEHRLERMLVVAGDYFLYVRNRARDLPPAPSLDALFQATHATRGQMIADLDCELSTGRVGGPVEARTGSTAWGITASTLPWLEGQRLALVDSIEVTANAELAVSSGTGTTVKVPINTFSRTALDSLFRRR